MQTLIERIRERLQHNAYANEAAISHGVVTPILSALGWDIADPAQMVPEYSIDRGRVDFALFGLGHRPAVFIEVIRRFGRETQRNYIRDVGRFATFLGRSPDTATAEEVRRFQVEQCELGVPVPTMNAIVSALRFFFIQTRPARPGAQAGSHAARAQVADRAQSGRGGAAAGRDHVPEASGGLSVAYGAGLRAAEIAGLKVRDIDSERMLLRVERGKGGRYRNAMLPTGLLALLREWWRVGRQEGVLHVDGWLFPGQHYLKPLSTRQLHRIVVEASVAAGIGKRVGPHTLRHCFATHLLEDGIDVRIIQTLLGHAKLETTAYYTQVATRVLRNVTSPFDRLAMAAMEARTPSG